MDDSLSSSSTSRARDYRQSARLDSNRSVVIRAELGLSWVSRPAETELLLAANVAVVDHGSRHGSWDAGLEGRGWAILGNGVRATLCILLPLMPCLACRACRQPDHH